MVFTIARNETAPVEVISDMLVLNIIYEVQLETLISPKPYPAR